MRRYTQAFPFSDISKDDEVQSDSFLAITADMPAIDRGLELYRNPSSRAAVEWFYLHVTGNLDVTHAILTEADRNDIPLALAFAIAYTESRYKPNAVHTNENQSIDRGLFQLNDRSFPSLTEKDFFDPAMSAKFGMRHFRFCMETGGDERTALAIYNAGVSRVIADNMPVSTVSYVNNIMKYKNRLDTSFVDEIASLYPSEKDNAPRLAYSK